MNTLSRRSLLLVPVLFLASGCCWWHDHDVVGPSHLGARVTLRPGETVEIDHHDYVAVRFNHVVEDSRCPANAICVQPGRAVVELTVFTEHDTDTLVLSTEAGQRAGMTEDVLVELVSVDPYPAVAHAIPASDYRVTVNVTR